MKKLAAVLLTTVSLSISSGALANDHSKPMTMAAAVLDQTIADGQLNFAVAAVGNAGGQTWSYAAGYQDAEKTNVASPGQHYTDCLDDQACHHYCGAAAHGARQA